MDLTFLLFVEQIVDFCCGSNDFSCLMKNKLDEMGKDCSYKNYDLFKPKVNVFPCLVCAHFWWKLYKHVGRNLFSMEENALRNDDRR